MISKACQYAIKSIIYLGKCPPGIKIPLQEISDSIDSPPAFTSKILQQLVAGGYLISTKGNKGGFEFPEGLRDDLALGDIIRVIDGLELQEGCLLGFQECSRANPCPIHDYYTEIKRILKQSIFSLTIDDLLKYNKNKIKLRG